MKSGASTVKVWSFQAEAQLHALLRDSLLTGHWTHVSPDETAAYRFMCLAMAERGLSCGVHPPVWGWHSCGAHQRPPGAEVARMLLSDDQLEDGRMVLLELDCPADQVLLSDYGAWCDSVYFAEAAARWSDTPQKARRLFETDSAALTPDALIQATLPCIRRDWLVQARQLALDAQGGVRILDAPCPPQGF
ncbi:DUF3841 domain-containing protein [Variovorax boronicumulans]|uniref:DUF3841 domain-containing protein n=1 Tax=Variovorax boronicumulans TaxID=436515 RepID=UPI001C583F33